MAVFTVNGQKVEPTGNQKLLRFLRDELHLTSVKDGCSEGACGACTVIIDGKTCKACVPDTDLLDGRTVITVEGLTEWEREVYTYAYGKAGAVQCGFCIPGMVMCTKALLDVNKEPTDDEIKYALRNNYCRCTGYVKIMDAVRLAAKVLKTGVIPDDLDPDWNIGHRVSRVDVEEKVLGTGKYPDDFYFDGMLYGVALRSKYPRARVLEIDTAAAKALSGVEAVLTAEDIPGENKIGHLKHDQYSLIPVGGLTHYLGDAIAVIAAKDRETAEKAKKLIKVKYEVLPHIRTIEEAAAEDAPKVFDEEENNICAHKHISRGNADEPHPARRRKLVPRRLSRRRDRPGRTRAPARRRRTCRRVGRGRRHAPYARSGTRRRGIGRGAVYRTRRRIGDMVPRISGSAAAACMTAAVGRRFPAEI